MFLISGTFSLFTVLPGTFFLLAVISALLTVICGSFPLLDYSFVYCGNWNVPLFAVLTGPLALLTVITGTFSVY